MWVFSPKFYPSKILYRTVITMVTIVLIIVGPFQALQKFYTHILYFATYQVCYLIKV